MYNQCQRLGRLGEDLAARHFEDRGYRIRARNVRYRAGEIDLVIQNDDCLVFVEVRTRRGQSYGAPEESITLAKQQRLLELAQTYLQEHAAEELPGEWRIDVVVIELDRQARVSRFEVIENAVAGA